MEQKMLISCKSCSVAFPQKSIRTHINRSKGCKAGYTDDDIKELEKLSEEMRKKKRAEKHKATYDPKKELNSTKPHMILKKLHKHISKDHMILRRRKMLIEHPTTQRKELKNTRQPMTHKNVN